MRCFAQTQQQGCLQISSRSVWKTKRGFTSTSLTSYNKQNNVFLMNGESCLPLSLPALAQSNWLVVGFPWLQLVVSRWWMGKVGGGCLLPFSFGTSHGLTGTLWRSTHTTPPAGTATESPRKCPLFHFHIQHVSSHSLIKSNATWPVIMWSRHVKSNETPVQCCFTIRMNYVDITRRTSKWVH